MADTYHQLLQEEKTEVADFVQPNLNVDSASEPGASIPYGASPYNVAIPAGQPQQAGQDVPVGQPVNAPILQEILPSELWPHNFIIFSIILAIVLGVMNELTLPLTIVSIAVGVMGHHQSKRGKYSTAKFYSKISITLLFLAVLFYLLCLFIGFMIPAILLPTFAHRYSRRRV